MYIAHQHRHLFETSCVAASRSSSNLHIGPIRSCATAASTWTFLVYTIECGELRLDLKETCGYQGGFDGRSFAVHPGNVSRSFATRRVRKLTEERQIGDDTWTDPSRNLPCSGYSSRADAKSTTSNFTTFYDSRWDQTCYRTFPLLPSGVQRTIV